jgi:type II secretory pathway pseudopilin PulG
MNPAPKQHINKWKGSAEAAFSLMELLVVIGIIGLLAGVTIPAIRSMTKSHATVTADRQLLDDISFARAKAISGHTTVYMVFVPASVINIINTTDRGIGKQLTNLYGGQFTMYSLLALRSVGEQPGVATPRYLTPWRVMPNGTFIATNKYALYDPNVTNGTRAFSTNGFPFPFSTNVTTKMMLPCIGFNYLGQLVSGRDEYLPIAHGSIFYGRDATGAFAAQAADVAENPPGNTIYSPAYPNNNYNQIHIEWLTGRAHVEKLEVQ